MRSIFKGRGISIYNFKMSNKISFSLIELLYVAPVNGWDTSFPTPEQMKHKIFIKGSKNKIIDFDYLYTRTYPIFYSYELCYVSEPQAEQIDDYKESINILKTQTSVIQNDRGENDVQNTKNSKWFIRKRSKTGKASEVITLGLCSTDQFDTGAQRFLRYNQLFRNEKV